MTYDPNTDPNAPQNRMRDDDSMGWGIPALIVAVLILGGILFYSFSGDQTTTAGIDKNPPATTRTTPAPTPAPAPAPAPAPKQ